MKRVFLFLLILVGMGVTSNGGSDQSISGSSGFRDEAMETSRLIALRPAAGAPSPVCAVLKEFPRSASEKMSFEKGEVGALCRPFVKKSRSSLDLCGDTTSDPYTSKFTWATRKEMYRRGKINLVSDPHYKGLQTLFETRAADIRKSASKLCCGTDEKCLAAMDSVEVSLCKPIENGDSPDPCVFGGSYTMSGDGYSTIFGTIQHTYATQESSELRDIASRNLGFYGVGKFRADFSADGRSLDPKLNLAFPRTGKIVLTSYVEAREGISDLIPTLHHELGHACSMIKMQLSAVAAGSSSGELARATRAVHWLNLVKDRCDANLKLPEAYFDFWESLGESREFAQCLYRIADANQKNQVDRSCPKLCPGHYLEESVGIAFSLLNGDLRGNADSVFPNTCDHVRDGQHPMVSDVVDCLAQYSPRFRSRLADTYGCGLNDGADPGKVVAKNAN